MSQDWLVTSLGGVFILTSRGFCLNDQPERDPQVSELHQTAKRAHHEADSFTLFCSSQNRHQKLNGTVTGLTHDRRVDGGPKLVGTVAPVRFEIPGRAATHSSK